MGGLTILTTPTKEMTILMMITMRRFRRLTMVMTMRRLHLRRNRRLRVLPLSRRLHRNRRRLRIRRFLRRFHTQGEHTCTLR